MAGLPGFGNILSSGGQGSNMFGSNPNANFGVNNFGSTYGAGNNYGVPGFAPQQSGNLTTPWGGLGPLGKMQGITQGLGAVTSLANLYGMFKNLSFQKKAFKFAQEGTKRNFNAQATGFNNQVDQSQGARHASALANNRSLDTLSQYAPQKVGLWT